MLGEISPKTDAASNSASVGQVFLEFGTGRQRVGSAVSGAHEIPREAFRQVSMCCITISGKCPMDRRISDCGMVCLVDSRRVACNGGDNRLVQPRVVPV
jgi:hypothetical protein